MAIEWLQQGIKSQINAFLSIGTKYIKDEYIEIANNELQFYNATLEWNQYEDWKKSRNPKRAILEEKFGYDCKHAMHLVRLLRMAKEYLENNQLYVDRTFIDAEELKEIRNGSWSFDKLEQYALEKELELNGLYENSKLNKFPNREKITELCETIVEDFLYKKHVI